ncbi:hypothetical protein I4U23_022881 [Adineta vaga]|nr:hypothetical protein I4U23_022881 [Adineta vaga]
MTTGKKMIFITSNEDLVQQISSKQMKNTHIIDLDTGEQIISSFSTNSSKKSIKRSKKSLNSVCVICGDHAIGHNYDVLSCASCKAFFHRYAHEKLDKLKCLTGTNQCIIEYRTDRKCFRCRLNKCFSMGMRKDFILNQQQLQQRRKHPKTAESIYNPAHNEDSISQEFDEIDRLLLNINEDDINNVLNENFETNNVEDLSIIHNIQSLFLLFFENQSENILDSIDLSNHVSAIISWAQFDCEIALQTIRYFRQINEFENLHTDDRFLLIKYNLFALMLIRKSFRYRQTNFRSPDEIHKEKETKARFLTLCNTSNDLEDKMNSLNDSIIQYAEQDPILLSLILIISLFSPTLSVNLDEPIFKDSLSIYRAQVLYTKVLWNYLIQKPDETTACQKFVQLTKIIFHVQLTSTAVRKFMCDQIIISNSVDKITALMQTILHI